MLIVDGYRTSCLKPFKCSKLSNIEGVWRGVKRRNLLKNFLFIFTHQILLFINLEQQWTLNLSRLDRSLNYAFLCLSLVCTQKKWCDFMHLEFNFQKVPTLSNPRHSPAFIEHRVLTWVDKRLTIGCTSTVKRIKFPVHVLTIYLFTIQFNIIVSSRPKCQSKTLSIFLFLENIQLNFSLYVWHILCKFAQKADSFIILFHHFSMLLLLLLLWTGFCSLSSWISLYPDLLHATNTKYAALYVDLPSGINLNLHKMKGYTAVRCVVVA